MAAARAVKRFGPAQPYVEFEPEFAPGLRRELPGDGEPARRRSLDAAHVEERGAHRGVFDQRRGGVERVEQRVPGRAHARRLVEEGHRFTGARVRLQEGHPGPGPERRGGGRHGQHAPALEGIREQIGPSARGGSAASDRATAMENVGMKQATTGMGGHDKSNVRSSQGEIV